MKIAYLVNQYPKVSHSFVRRELLALERQGFEIERYALRGWELELPDPADQREQARTRYLIRKGPLPLLWRAVREAVNHPRHFGRALKAAWQQWRGGDRSLARNLITLAEACELRHWVQRDQVTHVHVHFGTNGTQVARLARLLGGAPYSFTAHGQDEWDAPRQLNLRDKIHEAKFAVGISSFSASQLQRWAHRDDWPRIHVMHCGVEKTFLEESLTPVPDVPRLVCVGRLCAEKAQLLLLEAVARLVGEGREIELVLAGDGEMRAEVEARIERLGLGAHVRITGWISGVQVREELLAARALVLPSFSEGLPVVIMEALALGRPVVSSYVGGIPELVRADQEGWLVPAGSLDELCAALRRVLDTSVHRLTVMGASGRVQVRRRHHIDQIATRLALLIDDGRASGAAGTSGPGATPPATRPRIPIRVPSTREAADASRRVALALADVS